VLKKERETNIFFLSCRCTDIAPVQTIIIYCVLGNSIRGADARERKQITNIFFLSSQRTDITPVQTIIISCVLRNPIRGAGARERERERLIYSFYLAGVPI
jgi:hypothetical protein